MNMLQRTVVQIGLTALVLGSTKSVDVIEIVSEAEKIRSVENAELLVDLETVVPGRTTTRTINYEMKIHRSSGKRAFVDFLGPTTEKGRKMLVVNDGYWAKFPDSKRVHRISRKEMIGNSVFQLVDLFQLDARTDYESSLIGYVKIGGKKCYQIKLTAKHDAAPYAAVDYFVEVEGNFPVKAFFYSSTGKKIKTLEVLERQKLGSLVRPAKFKMLDNITVGKVSIWKTMGLDEKDIPDGVFHKAHLMAH